jgi:hypothetical protein
LTLLLLLLTGAGSVRGLGRGRFVQILLELFEELVEVVLVLEVTFDGDALLFTVWRELGASKLDLFNANINVS